MIPPFACPQRCMTGFGETLFYQRLPHLHSALTGRLLLLSLDRSLSVPHFPHDMSHVPAHEPIRRLLPVIVSSCIPGGGPWVNLWLTARFAEAEPLPVRF